MPPKSIALLMFAYLASASPGFAQSNPKWTRPFPPFRIIGNVYWVGSYDLSTYLITTPQGHILINTGVGDTAKQIKASVEQLGFKLADTKILTATHGHFDHVAGMAELKRMTGAQLIVSDHEKDLQSRSLRRSAGLHGVGRAAGEGVSGATGARARLQVITSLTASPRPRC